MIDLPTVSLIAADSVQPQEAVQALRACVSGVNFHRVILFTDQDVKLEFGELIKIPKLNTWASYSYFIIRELHKYLTTESHVLICQHDGFVINPHLWTNDFLDYDYIGHKWNTKGMNGGFSLRSTRLHRFLNQPHKHNPNFMKNCHPEDVAITRMYRTDFPQDYKFPTHDICDRFSTKGKSETAFGFHLRKSEWAELNNRITTKG